MAGSYQDPDSAIVGDYRGGGMERAMRCIYKNLDDVIILPEEVVYKYITPNEDLEELVFVSRPELDRHLTLTATVSIVPPLVLNDPYEGFFLHLTGLLAG